MENNNDLIELQEYTIIKRPSIKEPEKIKLWVRSGGRCAVCNKYLLDLEYDVSIGEMAHIVGWSKAKKSPRGDSELPLEDRNQVENLVLLCSDHHKIVDTKNLLEEFTIERLIENKNRHESRIHHLTSLNLDSESLVIRMLGGIRGANIEVSKEHTRNVIYQSEQKYPRFLDSFDKHGIEIDLNALPDPEISWDAYWEIGINIINQRLIPLDQGVNQGIIRHLSVFALARIPLLIYLGYKLDDKIPTTIYQKHRGEDETWLWSEDAQIENFEVIHVSSKDNNNVALILSLSGSIGLSGLPTEITDYYNIYEIHPIGTIPNRNILRNKGSYENFSNTYHLFLSQLEVCHKGCTNILLFPAIPSSAAIACGRGIMRDAQPSLTIYDLSEKNFKPTITINAHEVN